eukprot:TRINITY_DN11755_c0_g1_i1.p1 TRINITY_DN11755_c0_g1~~TRINITY_DN11755_c0_g1_i1.p1  ORF type:complete len:548 (+),score=157.77 TRINITY_DN11755_c0_g1_i1:2-1645(+)
MEGDSGSNGRRVAQYLEDIPKNGSQIASDSFLNFLVKHRQCFSSAVWKCLSQLDQGHTETITKLSKALVSVFCYGSISNMMDVIKVFIYEEVQLAKDQSGTLFRSNGIASQVLTVFVKEIGYAYLAQQISPVILKMMEDTTEGVSFEVDPQKSKNPSQLQRSIDHLSNLIKAFTNAILSSTQEVPTVIRKICVMLREGTTCLPESRYSVIGGFFFLRFVCPNIISPDDLFYINDQKPTISADMRRSLVLSCKILQTAANSTTLRESYLEPFAPLVADLKTTLSKFFDDISEVTETEVPSTYFETQENCDINLEIIKDFLLKNIKPMSKLMLEYSSVEENLVADLSVIQSLPNFSPHQTTKTKFGAKPSDRRAKLTSSIITSTGPTVKRTNFGRERSSSYNTPNAGKKIGTKAFFSTYPNPTTSLEGSFTTPNPSIPNSQSPPHTTNTQNTQNMNPHTSTVSNSAPVKKSRADSQKEVAVFQSNVVLVTNGAQEVNNTRLSKAQREKNKLRLALEAQKEKKKERSQKSRSLGVTGRDKGKLIRKDTDQ